MTIRRTLESLTLAAAAFVSGACHGDKITAPPHFTPVPSVVITSPVNTVSFGYVADTVRLLAHASAGTKLFVDNVPVDSGATYNRLLTFTDHSQTYEFREPNQATTRFYLLGNPLPALSMSVPAAAVEDSILGAHVTVTATTPSSATATLTVDGVAVPLQGGPQTLFLSSDPDSSKTTVHTVALNATVPGFNGPRALPQQFAAVTVSAARADSVDATGNYVLTGYPGVVHVADRPGTGTPGANTLVVKNGASGVTGVNGTAIIQYAPITTVGSPLQLQATTRNPTVNRSLTTPIALPAYFIPTATITHSAATDAYTINRLVPPSFIADLVKDQNLTLTAGVYDASGTLLTTKQVSVTQPSVTFTLPAGASASTCVIQVPFSGGATFNNLGYVPVTVQVKQVP